MPSVPVEFSNKLKSYDAKVVIEGHDYEASMEAAERDAKLNIIEPLPGKERNIG